MLINPDIFKTYDIRAKIPHQLDMAGVKRIGQSIADYFKPEKVIIGYDVRLTGYQIFNILSQVFIDAGADVLSLGMVSTDMVYYSSGSFDYDLSIMVTASHNPPEYNGFKIVTKGAKAVSRETGLEEIKKIALSNKKLNPASQKGTLTEKDIYKDWIDFCLSFVDLKKIRRSKIVIDAGNGVGGRLFGHPYLVKKLPVEIIPLYFQPDGNFPNHVPNPLNQDNLLPIRQKVSDHQADFGALLDGDGDRIAFITDQGEFVSGTVTTALLARELLKDNPGQTILYNAVCGRIVPEIIRSSGGVPKRVRVGHSLIRQAMADHNALFAGEHACHYFYRQIYNSESSLVSFLLTLEYLSTKKKSFSSLLQEIDRYPQSGEINFQVEDKDKIMKAIEKKFKHKAEKSDWLDGLSLWFDNWWVNIRPSNTQPLLRLNLEADNQQILDNKTEEIISLIKSLGGKKSSD